MMVRLTLANGNPVDVSINQLVGFTPSSSGGTVDVYVLGVPAALLPFKVTETMTQLENWLGRIN